MHEEAAQLLNEIAADSQSIQAAIVAAQDISALVHLLGSSHQVVQYCAARLVALLTKNSSANSRAVAAAGGVQLLVPLMMS